MRLVARVPGTAANLGPGFDCLALALDLCNEVTLDTGAAPAVFWQGEGADELPTDGSDLISLAMTKVARDHEVALPPFALHGVNRIPLARGLGSSAAAAVAGVVLADRLLGLGLDPGRHLEAAAAIEGHPDNAAAAVYGGLTIATEPGSRAIRLPPHPSLRPAVLIPEAIRLPTDEARRALPDAVTFADAAFNAGRSALAVVALTSEPEQLSRALEDRLHQSARLTLVPGVRDVFERVREAGLPVCVSGAGPSLLAFESDTWSVPNLGKEWRVLRVAPRGKGAEVAEVAKVAEDLQRG